MSHQVRIEPAGRILTVEDSETILDAALRSGVALPYSCRGGSCGTCKSKLLAGRVDYGQYEDRAMSAAERAAGSVLICQAKPLSDVVIEARVLEQAADIPIRILPCRVVGLERAAPDVMVVSLKLPEHERFQYLAGQYIDILLRDSARRSFSLAHAPGRDELLELHIRQVPGGLFTTHVFEKLKERDLLRFQGPYGSFFLREGSSPVILVAGGTGFAPMQAIIEQVLAAQPDRPLHLYWGARARPDLYRHELAERWAEQHPDFRYTPVLSEPDPADAWSGRTGFVHQAVLADYPDLSGCEVYASGPPVMVESIRREFLARGLPPDRLYSDSFEFSHDRR
ncbi:MAG: CDP-6-deoxy-delta-3,4-glucoseen reductase [Pseudomonadota bacterium]